MKNDEKIKTQKKTTRRKYIIGIFFIILIATSLSLCFFQKEPEPDPESEALIRQLAAESLQKDPNDLTDEDLAKITRLSLIRNSHSDVFNYVEISDIKLLEKFTNLEYLSLRKITFPDKKIPKWAKKLSMLGIECFENRYVINFKPLQNLTNLNNLDLRNTMISDLRPLKELKKLEKLNLNNTKISNIKPLQNLTNLNYIDLSNTKISDLTPLKDLMKLETLILDKTQISNIESLKNLKNMQKLSIINCPNITNEQIHGLQEIYPELEIISVKERGFGF